MGGPSVLFRFLIAGITAILVVSVMSMAFNFVIAESAGGITGGVTQSGQPSAAVFMTAQVLVGIITFLGSLHVMSKR